MKIRTKLNFITLCLSATLAASVNAKDVTIYYTNDLHAHVSPGKIPAVDKERLVGGFANIATIVNDAKKRNKDVFFFDAGDYFTGPYISTLTKGEAIIDIMNTMPFDAVSVGNHEFDHGVDNMVKQLSKAKFPVLLGNVFILTVTNPSGTNPGRLSKKMA